MLTLPILDWQRFAGGSDRDGFVEDLGRACRETGFFLLENHGIDAALISETFAAGDALFDMDTEDKAPLALANNRTTGGGRVSERRTWTTANQTKWTRKKPLTSASTWQRTTPASWRGSLFVGSTSGRKSRISRHDTGLFRGRARPGHQPPPGFRARPRVGGELLPALCRSAFGDAPAPQLSACAGRPE